MVDNRYASLSDFEHTDFNPYKWSLYLEYHITAEKLPTIIEVTICENCNMFYNLSWGIRVGISPSREYLAITYSVYGDWKLRVAILSPDGNTVRLHVIDGTNVRFGYTDIAANDTGFFITLGPQRTRFIFVPYTPDAPIYEPVDVHPYGNRHDGPIAVWNPYNNTWTIIYGH